MDLSQWGNMYDASALLAEGGENGTYFKVVHVSDQITSFTDFPSIKDGKQLRYDHPDYWKYKTRRTRQALQLTVTGNAVTCERILKEAGYDAHAIQSSVVMIVLPDSKSIVERN